MQHFAAFHLKITVCKRSVCGFPEYKRFILNIVEDKAFSSKPTDTTNEIVGQNGNVGVFIFNFCDVKPMLNVFCFQTN